MKPFIGRPASVHPFPARMAPDVVIDRLRYIKRGSTVLDSMSGSGVVLRSASSLGHQAIGVDSDPLAVLMAKVWTTTIDEVTFSRVVAEFWSHFESTELSSVELPWIDGDELSRKYIDFWFGAEQIPSLRKMAFALYKMSGRKRRRTTLDCVDVLRIALSRIIVTKDSGASLARDASHSRPHRVKTESDFDVELAMRKSIEKLSRILLREPPCGRVEVFRGDARDLSRLSNSSVDLVLTSPPYLNAIDYMRGHRLSLVWLGYMLSDLKDIRSENIGSERLPASRHHDPVFAAIAESTGSIDKLTSRQKGMVLRYSQDMYRVMSSLRRVLKRRGNAMFIVADSNLKGVKVSNSNAIVSAANAVGLKLTDRTERLIPAGSRYLPINRKSGTQLSARMKTESVLTFSHS